MAYAGISTKRMKNGTNAIMVRFKHNGITYPVKNFTKLFGITTESEANKQLQKIKISLSEGNDPFSSSLDTLNQIWENKIQLNKKNGVWKETTIKNYVYFYDKHIRKEIGKYKLEKITLDKLKNIFNTFTNIQSIQKSRVFDILYPIFQDAKNENKIQVNQLDKIKKDKIVYQKEHLSKRTNHSYKEIVRNLYNAIPKYDQARKENIEVHRIFLMMLLMTSHRFGEIIQLEKKHCNLEENKIISPKSITKTNEEYHFPIPEECIEYIKKSPEGKLFDIPRGGTTSRIFHRLLMKANITTNNEHNISMHDTRKLMLSIMITELNIDSRLADYCLDHKQQGTIKHYLQFTYEDKVKAYKKYWNFIRNNVILEEKSENGIIGLNDNSNFEKLKELITMVENGYITKEQFEYERDKLYS